MTDYIKRSDAAKLLGYIFGVDVVLRLHEVPAADVAEVVYCKDCKVRRLRQQVKRRYGLSANKRRLLAEGNGFLQLRRAEGRRRRQCFRLSFYRVACTGYTL